MMPINTRNERRIHAPRRPCGRFLAIDHRLAKALRRGREWHMPTKTNLEALREGMAQALRRDPRVIITGEDVGPRGGVFRATEGLYAEFGPSRVIDSPLSELSIVAVRIGMALNGLRPICEIQFVDFIHPCLLYTSPSP